MTELRVWGCKRSGYSPFDISFNTVAPRFDQKDTTRGSNAYEIILEEKTPISDQGSVGSCTGNSACDALEMLLGLENERVDQLSRLMAYYLARLSEGTVKQDVGATLRSVWTMLRKRGVCLESLWPYDVTKALLEPTLAALMSGDSNKPTNFYLITSAGGARIDDVEMALRARHPVNFGIYVDTRFMNCESNEVLQSPDLSDHDGGGHAILFTGVSRLATGRRRFLVRNSWGLDWGMPENPGHCWVDEDWIRYCDEIWVPTRMPALVR